MPRRSEPPTPPPEDGRKPSSPRPTHALAIDTKSANYSRSRPTVVSPPPTPQSTRHDKLSFRLRSNSGLSLHTNEDALRRYTDYNADGSPRTPTFEPVGWGSIDGVATGPRPTTGRQMSVDRPEPSLPIPDFFSQATFQMVLANPPTRDRFLQFTRRHGIASDVEFLLGVANYSRAVSQFVDQFVTVPRPIDLPFALSRSLNVDLKHISATVLPGLSTVFSDSTSFVEKRVRHESYPPFVTQQLSLRAGAALSGDTNPRSADFRGLGTSFFLADAQHADIPIISVSDGFLALTGYSREETLLRSSLFLEGSKTDHTTSSRIGNAVRQGVEVAEVILHYRRDSWPFWDMVCLVPLMDEDGVVRRYLGGHVNVSDTLANQDDILRALSYGPSCPDTSDVEEEDDSRASRRTSTRDCAPDRAPSVRQRSGSTKGFFKQFKKSSGSPVSHSASASISNPSASSLSLEDSRGSLHHYARFFLLRPVPSSPTTPTPESSRSKRAPSLRVVYASPAALDLFDIQLSPPACQGVDVFSLLADEAGSPSITKTFRSTIYQRVIQDKQCEKLNIFLGRSQHRRQGSVSAPLTSRSTVDVRDNRGEKKKERRPSRPVSRSGFASLVGSETSRADMITSHWAPLKDVTGAVEYVVVILSPA